MFQHQRSCKQKSRKKQALGTEGREICPMSPRINSGLGVAKDMNSCEGLGGPHPFLIPSIVSELLDLLAPEQIKLCRLVCKTWHIEGSEILRRRRCKLNLCTERRVKSLMEQNDMKGNLSVIIGTNFGKKNPIIHSFFQKAGKNIVSLEFTNPSWSGFVSLRKFLAENVPNIESLTFQLLPPTSGYGHIPTWNEQNPAHDLYSLRKLKTLTFTIDYSNYWTIMEQESIKPFLRHLLSGMPNLETISCPRYPDNFIETFQYEVQILFRETPNLRPLICLLSEPHGPHLPKLKNLDIPLKFWANIPSLQERNYPLETLDWFIGLEVTSQQIDNFLTQIGKTLKTLSLDFTTAGKFLREVNYEPCNSFPSAKNFQKMDTLTLRSFKGSVALMLQIPALKNLILTKARSLEMLFDETNFHKTTRYPSLATLTVDQYNPKDAVNSATLERIGSTFENIRKLEIRFLSDSSLRSICQHFPCLEELIAVDGIFSDAGVTGIPESRLDHVVQNKLGVPFKHISKYRKHPYVGSLSNLRKLDLRSKHVTGHSVFFGILHCHNLTNLTLMGYGFSNVSLCAISDEMNLSFFTTIFCHQLTMEGAEYIKVRMSHCELHLNELQKPLNGMDIYRLGLFQSGTVPVRKRRITSVSDNDEVPRRQRRKSRNRHTLLDATSKRRRLVNLKYNHVS